MWVGAIYLQTSKLGYNSSSVDAKEGMKKASAIGLISSACFNAKP